MSAKRDDDEDLRRILKEQYNHVEAYCNSQTRLQNALVGRRDGRSRVFHQQYLEKVTLDLSDCTEKVQENLKRLSSHRQLVDRNKQQALDTHVARSKRVLETIYQNGGKLSPLGIPVSKDDDETKTVALATLRASIAQVEKALAVWGRQLRQLRGSLFRKRAHSWVATSVSLKETLCLEQSQILHFIYLAWLLTWRMRGRMKFLTWIQLLQNEEWHMSLGYKSSKVYKMLS